MKKILVPIDFTDYSNNAFRMATYIARIKGMSIKLLHIHKEEPAFKLGPHFPSIKKTNKEYSEELEKMAAEHLRRLVSLESTNEIRVEYEIRKSKAGIAKEILKEECDLIIMGRKHEDNDDVFFRGTVAENVVRMSPVPVITVGELPEGFQLKKIVFAADFKDDGIRPILSRVFDLARIFKAELHFLYVVINREFLGDDATTQKVKETISNFDLQGHEVDVYFAPTPEEGMGQYIDDINADLLALCTHGRTGVVHFFVGSIAENMSAFANIPVLTYNINPKKVERSTKPITREKIVWSKKSWEKS